MGSAGPAGRSEENLALGGGPAAVRVGRAPGRDQDPLDGEVDGLPVRGPMLRGVTRSRAGEVEGCHGAAGGLKRSGQRQVRDVHIQDDRDRASRQCEHTAEQPRP